SPRVQFESRLRLHLLCAPRQLRNHVTPGWYAKRDGSAAHHQRQERWRGSCMHRAGMAKRKCDREYGTMTALAGEADRATMCFYDGLCDGQPHTRSFYGVALIFSAVE